jgi:hypothetical protein
MWLMAKRTKVRMPEGLRHRFKVSHISEINDQRNGQTTFFHTLESASEKWEKRARLSVFLLRDFDFHALELR